MNPIIKFFHELLNPHCEHCTQIRMQELEQKEIEREVNQVCQSCENLKIQLAVMNQLVDKLTNKEVIPVAVAENQPHKVIKPGHVPWRVRQQELEVASRLKAQELRAEQSVKVPQTDTHSAQTALLNGTMKAEIKPMISELEEELGISTGTDNGTETISN